MATTPGVHGRILTVRNLPGMTLSESVYEPGQRLPRHAHAVPYYCFVVAGSYSECRSGRIYTCLPSSLLFHPPEDAHANAFGRVRTRCFNVELGNVPGDAASALGAPIHFHHGPAVAAAARMYREYRRTDHASTLVLQGLLFELAGECAREPRHRDASGPAWTSQCWDLLHDRFREPLTLSAVARDLKLHPAHVARTFRQAYGCSVGELVRRLRIRWAADALAGSALPLAQIASEAGFNDQSHFTREFRRCIGITPGQYRQNASRR